MTRRGAHGQLLLVRIHRHDRHALAIEGLETNLRDAIEQALRRGLGSHGSAHLTELDQLVVILLEIVENLLLAPHDLIAAASEATVPHERINRKGKRGDV